MTGVRLPDGSEMKVPLAVDVSTGTNWAEPKG